MIIFIILSFFLEGIVTNLVGLNSLFLPLFSISSLVIVYSYFNKDKKYYFILLSTILGMFYDIVYTDSLFINTFTYCVCGLVIILIYNFLQSTFYNTMIINFIMILLYRLISYLLLVVFSFIKFDFSYLFKGIYSSLILNVIYGTILYFVCYKISKKFNIRKND